MTRKKNIYFIYVLLLLLIAISAIPVTRPVNDQILLGLFIVSAINFKVRNLILDKGFIQFLAIFIGLIITQLFIFDILPYYTVMGLILKILTPYLIIKIIGKKFFPFYINIIYVFTLISFLFWIPAAISPVFKSLLISNAPFESELYTNGSYILYHLTFGGELSPLARNSGPFWEPGVFGGFLLIAFMSNFLKNKNYFEKKNLIFILGIISTFSTTAYFALFFFMLGYYFIQHKNFYFIIILLVLLPLGYYAYNNIYFLKDKIDSQVEMSSDKSAYLKHRTRFSSAIIDFQDFKKHPLIGKGKFEQSRFDDYRVATNRNNGTTDLLVIFGLIGFITYFFYYYKTFFKYIIRLQLNSQFAILMVIIILILGFSENYFLLPFFWGICYLRYT